LKPTALTIRNGRGDDDAALSAFARRVFVEAFGRDNHPRDLAAYIAEAYGPGRQHAELIDPGLVTLLAEADGRLAGFAQLRRRTQPAGIKVPAGVELWRFYVDGPHQRTGLSRQLMAASLKAARGLGGRAVWLSVWERNPRAIAFYRKMGFAAAGRNDFWVGSDRQNDIIMIASLTPSTGAAP
jgi:ribosomal protein S18 acetylase RimI-like enzyme